jgi:hypothetical protein
MFIQLLVPSQERERSCSFGAAVAVIVWALDLQLPMKSVPITTKVVSSNPTQAIHYVIKFVSDLRQVGGFLWILRFTPPVKLIGTI